LIRGWLCLTVIIIATALASPALSSPFHAYSPGVQGLAPQASVDPLTGSGALTAFNYTLSSANIFTNATSKVTPAVNSSITNPHFKWFSTVNNTKTGSAIQGTAFNYTVNSPATPNLQQVAWNMTIPKSNCSTCETLVSFTLYGDLTKGASENFTLTNSTIPIESGIFQGINSTQLSICSLASSTNSSVCGKTVQLPIPSKYIGSTLTLTFKFGWNVTTASLKASVGEVIAESLDNTYKNSYTNSMTLSSSSPTSFVTHNATFFPVAYNNSIASWTNEVLNVYYPSGYNITQIQLNQTSGSPITILPSAPAVPFEKESCNDGNPPCAQALIAINMSDIEPVPIHNSTIYITAFTKNSISQVSTLSGGIATQFFTSGDQIGIDVVVSPSIVNASTSQQQGTVSLSFPPALQIAAFTSPLTATGGVYPFTLPSTCGTDNQLCDVPLTVIATFSSGFDLGNATGTFRINLLQVSLTGTGGTNSLSIQGTLDYGNGTAARNVNATLFAIDTGTPKNIPATNNQTKPSPSSLYISNVTLVNGVFTQGQPLIMLFTVVNPNNSTQAYNATVTIRHEWPGPQSHNMSVTFSLTPGDNLDDLPFNATSPQTYEANIMFAATGVQVTLENLRTSPDSISGNMTSGTSPVLPNAPHAGLFNITLTGMLRNGTMESRSSILSRTYAYVLPSLVPSRYLYASPVFTTNGAFSETINSSHLLGAENLTVFVLARDAFGVVVMNNLPSSFFTESTALISSANSIGPVGEGDSATATLHLTSNSTLSNGITELITVNLILQGNGIGPKTVATQTNVKIIPGGSQTIHLSFTAPSSVGSYTLTFSSPEYGGVLTVETLQVTILQGYIQLLIPAAIGIVAAIIILGVYLIREQREKKEDVETVKPKGPAQKPKPTSGGSPPSKSLTRTANVRS
jgi:hypothetical protein